MKKMEKARIITTTDRYFVKRASRGNFKLREIELPYNLTKDEVIVVKSTFGKGKR